MSARDNHTKLLCGAFRGAIFKATWVSIIWLCLELSNAWVSAKSSTEQWFVRGGVICRKEKSELGEQREAAAEGSDKGVNAGIVCCFKQ